MQKNAWERKPNEARYFQRWRPSAQQDSPPSLAPPLKMVRFVAFTFIPPHRTTNSKNFTACVDSYLLTHQRIPPSFISPAIKRYKSNAMKDNACLHVDLSRCTHIRRWDWTLLHMACPTGYHWREELARGVSNQTPKTCANRNERKRIGL